MKARPGVLAVGGISIDTVLTPDGVSGPHLGGNAVYTAVGAWLAGSTTSLCARIGSDFPAQLIDGLKQKGFRTSSIKTIDGPSLKVTLDDRTSRRRQSYAADSGHNAQLDPTPEDLEGLAADSAVHVCGISPSRQARLLKALDGHAVLVTLDTVVIPGEIEPEAELLVRMAKQSDAFLPSREETQHLWPGQPPRAVLRTLSAAGWQTAVIKLGAGGSIGIDSGRITWMPAFPVRARDTTGAGDAYCGGFAATFARDRELVRAMAWATAVASLVVEAFGALTQVTDAARRTAAERAHMLLSEHVRERVS